VTSKQIYPSFNQVIWDLGQIGFLKITCNNENAYLNGSY
jgi:hypothetical protein